MQKSPTEMPKNVSLESVGRLKIPGGKLKIPGGQHLSAKPVLSRHSSTSLDFPSSDESNGTSGSDTDELSNDGQLVVSNVPKQQKHVGGSKGDRKNLAFCCIYLLAMKPRPRNQSCTFSIYTQQTK